MHVQNKKSGNVYWHITSALFCANTHIAVSPAYMLVVQSLGQFGRSSKYTIKEVVQECYPVRHQLQYRGV